MTEPAAVTPDDPEEQVLLADSVGLALLVVLDTLTPTERLAFVLHDMFGVSFDEIAPIVGRSPDAARQLASRARRRVRARPGPARAAGRAGREIVDAFLQAARGGDLGTLLTLLDPDVRMRVDGRPGHAGASSVAQFFAGRAQAARPALVDGGLGLAVLADGRVRIVVRLTVVGGRITAIDAVTEPAALGDLDVALLDDQDPPDEP